MRMFLERSARRSGAITMRLALSSSGAGQPCADLIRRLTTSIDLRLTLISPISLCGPSACSTLVFSARVATCKPMTATTPKTTSAPTVHKTQRGIRLTATFYLPIALLTAERCHKFRDVPDRILRFVHDRCHRAYSYGKAP